jgi:hypothetical protein
VKQHIIVKKHHHAEMRERSGTILRIDGGSITSYLRYLSLDTKRGRDVCKFRAEAINQSSRNA